MNNPTHFIEVWKSYNTGIVYESDIAPICELSVTTEIHPVLNYATLFVWKIRAKISPYHNNLVDNIK